MELRQLSHFLAIVEHGSLGRAAKAINITEPALSKSIRKLEDNLQVRLLDRMTTGMVPTLFGQSLLARARTVLGEMETARRELDELRGASPGIVRVGMRPSFGSTVLPRALSRVQACNANIQAVLREGFMPTLVSEVIQGALDFVVVTEIESLDPILVQEPLSESPVGLLARSDHPLAARTRLSARQLADASWIMPLKSDPIRKQLETVLLAAGLNDIRVAVETNSVLTIVSYIRDSGAIGFFPKLMVDINMDHGDLAFLDVPGLSWRRQLTIVRRRRISLPPAAQLLIDELRAVSAEIATAKGI